MKFPLAPPPKRTYGLGGCYCRDYIMEYPDEGGIEREKASACPDEDGAWGKLVM